VFEGHHQPLRVWVLCLYFMGLNLSNEQIAAELDLGVGDAQAMTTQLREGIVVKKKVSAPNRWDTPLIKNGPRSILDVSIPPKGEHRETPYEPTDSDDSPD
jgi:hypothetical protein